MLWYFSSVHDEKSILYTGIKSFQLYVQSVLTNDIYQLPFNALMECRIYVSDEDIAFWEEHGTSPEVTIDSMRDVLRVFVNGQLQGN